MTDVATGPGKYPNRFRASGVKGRHLRAHILVVGWLALALLVVVARETLPVAHWLAVHMFLLGAVTTAILIWSEHFAVVLLHGKVPDTRWSTVRLAAADLAVAGLLIGVWAVLPVPAAASAALLVDAATGHLVMLVRLGRGALGGRLKPVVSLVGSLGVVGLATALPAGWTRAVSPPVRPTSAARSCLSRRFGIRAAVTEPCEPSKEP